MDEDLLKAIYIYTNKNKLDVRKDYDKRGTIYKCKDLEICFGSYWFKIFYKNQLIAVPDFSWQNLSYLEAYLDKIIKENKEILLEQFLLENGKSFQ